MKICFVNPTRLQRPIYVVAKHLADRGHTVTVLQPEGMIQRYPSWENVPLISLPCRYVPEARYALPSMRLEFQILEELIRKQGYELVHVQDYQNLTALPPIWIRKRCHIPITLVNNALVGVDWQYGKWFFDQVARIYTLTLGRQILHSYDRLFFLYEGLAQQAQTFLKDGIPSWEVIPIGVDPHLFYPMRGSTLRRKLGITDSENVILFVGRLSAVKRIEWVIELTSRLLSQRLPVRTIIVGGGQLGNLATEVHLRRLAGALDQAVLFVGPKGQSDLREYYAIADVVVLPSLSEGLPNVLLEASACAVPCVASDVGGVVDIIRHGETGYVFPPDNFEALVSYVETILNDQALARRMGQQSCEQVLTRFNWERITDRYEQVFRELVD